MSTRHKSTKVIPQWQLQKMTKIIADRWSETCEIVEARNSNKDDFQQRYKRHNFWVNHVSL